MERYLFLWTNYPNSAYFKTLFKYSKKVIYKNKKNYVKIFICLQKKADAFDALMNQFTCLICLDTLCDAMQSNCLLSNIMLYEVCKQTVYQYVPNVEHHKSVGKKKQLFEE